LVAGSAIAAEAETANVADNPDALTATATATAASRPFFTGDVSAARVVLSTGRLGRLGGWDRDESPRLGHSGWL